MFVRRSIRVAVLPALALCLTLAGCGGDEEIEPKMPETSSTTAASPTESSPTEPVEPTLPPEAEGDDAAAAEAFVRHYYDYVNYAQATGDTRGLTELGLRGCLACEGGIRWIEDVYSAGGQVEGGVYTLSDVRARRTGRSKSDLATFLVRATVTNTPQRITRAGKLNDEFRASTVSGSYYVVRGESAWRLARWEISE